MSEVIEAAPVTESVPTSTADVATQVIESYETPVESNTPEPATETPAAEPAELSPAAKFLLAQGHQSKKVDGRPVWLPVGTVEKMLDRYVGEHKTTWETRLTEAEKKAQDAAQYREAAEGYLTALRGDPKAFLSEIAQHDPRYRSFLEPPAAPTPEPAAPMDFPQPDYQLPDGAGTYTIKGLREQVFPWMLEQARQIAKSEAQTALKPWQEQQESIKAEKAQSALVEKTRGQIETAKSWENWTEYEGDVLKALQEDSAKAHAEGKRPSMTLREAYLEVKAAKLGEKATSARTSVLEELKNAPKSTSMPRTAEVTPKPVGPRSTQDIAAKTYERLERGA